ncbi:MAG: hypothetical protein QM579_04135, partial [Desulfovibrio sp.]|uniref:hypothetical protein n=1 Tax=Desulfovibrio sp. TaxID=885 RepID=UPI0039E2F895
FPGRLRTNLADVPASVLYDAAPAMACSLSGKQRGPRIVLYAINILELLMEATLFAGGPNSICGKTFVPAGTPLHPQKQLCSFPPLLPSRPVPARHNTFLIKIKSRTLQ